MSDFLTRVAERSLGVAPLIHPRIPNLFEPAETPPSSPERPVAAMHQEVGTGPVISGTPKSPTVADPSLSDASESDPKPYVSPEDKVNHWVAAHLPGPDVHQPTTVLAQQDSEPAAAPATTLIVKPVLPYRILTLEQTPPPYTETGLLADSVQLVPMLVQRPQGTGQSDLPVEAVHDSPESIVHITIGRVEVRANVGAPPPPTPRRPPQTQRGPSLSEYLKRSSSSQ